jgi:predicted alpha/beta-fold hydrolase
MGLGGMKYAWQRQTKDFAHTNADRYSSLVFDNRGIGESDKPRMRYSTSEMAKDVIEVVDHLGWTGKRDLHIVGISMGGMISQEIVRLVISLTVLSACISVLECSGSRMSRFPARHDAFPRHNAKGCKWSRLSSSCILD